MSACRIAVLPLLLLLACGGAGHFAPYAKEPAFPASRPQVITNLGFLGAGHQQAEAFVAALPAEERAPIQAAIDRAAAACVLIEVRTMIIGSSYRAEKGSGVLLQGRTPGSALRVGTAGHMFDSGSTNVHMVHSSGQSIAFAAARRQHVDYLDSGTSDQDWGLVEIAGPPSELRGLAVQAPQVGELAFVLAYPDGIGRDRSGRFVYGKAQELEPLLPLLTVAQVTQTAPLQLRPLAGAIPLGGASGGAIVNRDGAVIGLFNAVFASFESDGVSYWLNGASAAAIGGTTGK